MELKTKQNPKEVSPFLFFWRNLMFLPLFVGVSILYLASLVDLSDPWKNPLTLLWDVFVNTFFSVGVWVAYVSIYLGWGEKEARIFMEEATS